MTYAPLQKPRPVPLARPDRAPARSAPRRSISAVGGSPVDYPEASVASTGIQRKLNVGPAQDALEREADEIADFVTNDRPAPSAPSSRGSKHIQRTCAECEDDDTTPARPGAGRGVLRRKPSSPAASAVAPALEARVRSLHGGGAALPAALREDMETRLGYGLGKVRIHTDATAAQLASDVRARAFTLGSDVVFGANQYAPTSRSGRHLLAHELAHVVQQGQATPTSAAVARPAAAPAIQRKIFVDGKRYVPQRSYRRYLLDNFSLQMWDFVWGMHTQKARNDFTDYEQMGREVRLRFAAIDSMGLANVLAQDDPDACCSYADENSPVRGMLDPKYWDKDEGVAYKFYLRKGVLPSEAVEAIFKPNAGTVLECLTMMLAVQYRGLLHSMGPQKFDEKYLAERIVLTKKEDDHGLYGTGGFEKISVDGIADLLPGDWVYFKNDERYRKYEYPGYWAGEHTLYVGNKEFEGFGKPPMSVKQMKAVLIQEFNAGIPEANKRQEERQKQGKKRLPPLTPITDVPGPDFTNVRRPVHSQR